MNPASPEVAVRSATPELVNLAVTVRPDWDEDVVSGILRRAADEGMTWKQVLVNLPRLMADPAADPRDLLPDSRSPLISRTGVEANAEFLGERQRMRERTGR
jgi:hypothetical protein